MLADNRYGKSGIRLVKLVRRRDRHEIRDLTVAVELEGDFEAAHASGDNSSVLPTDTTVRASPSGSLSFASTGISIAVFRRVVAKSFTATGGS